MEIAKCYVSYKDFLNLSLVNKDFMSIMKDMKGPIYLSSLMNIYGWNTKECVIKFINKLQQIEQIKMMIETLEYYPSSKTDDHYSIKYNSKHKLLYRCCIKKNPTLNCLNLMI